MLKRCTAPPLNAKFATVNYGMSEGCPFSNWNIYAAQPEYKDVASVGHVLRGAKARICHPDSREMVPWGEIGELHMGNPFIVSGFPGRDESYLYEDAGVTWVITGDQGRLGEHNELYILGRYKEIIIRGGRNISPSAVEAVINLFPGVTSLVVGLPDEIAGEVPVAVVRCQDGSEYDENEIRVSVAKAVGQYAAPQKVVHLRSLGLSEFPLTSVGKADKRWLKDLVHQHYASIGDDQRANKINQKHDQTPSEGPLAEVWAGLTARRSSDISVTEAVTEYADSLLVLQATSRISRKTGKTITAEEILAHPTIEGQSKILDRRALNHAPSSTSPTISDGPPDATDIAHVRNDPTRYQHTQNIVGKFLAPLDFGWQDVQDVLPCYDNGRFMLEYARRLQSWGHRFTFVVQASPTRVREAVILSLRHHPLFRSVAVRYDQETWINVCLKSCTELYDHISKIVDKTISENDLSHFRYNDPDFDHASSMGFLFKTTIIPLGDGTTSGLIINSNHCMYDALSFSMWLEDFRQCLSGDTGAVTARIPYKQFADAYYFGRNGIVSEQNCEFFVNKLIGASQDRRAQWPPQKTRDWFMGEAAGWVSSDGVRLECISRKKATSLGHCGQTGLTAEVTLSDELQREHDVTLVNLFKTAVACFNVHATGASYALFSHWEAARNFPFLDDNPAYAALLPNAMDLAGPTGQRVVDRIAVSPDDKILNLLFKVQIESTETTRHAHAPIYRVKEMLEANSGSSAPTEDAAVFMDALQRQIFNWVPSLPAADETDSAVPDVTPQTVPLLRPVQQLSTGACGFVWTGKRLSHNTVRLFVWWDDAQMYLQEAKIAFAEVLASMKWISVSANWSRSLAEWWKSDGEKMTREAELDIGYGTGES